MVPLGPVSITKGLFASRTGGWRMRSWIPPREGRIGPAPGKDVGWTNTPSSANLDRRTKSKEPGSTYVLTGDGWEVSDYVDPADDWSLQSDGSYLSPDGAVRTWPLAAPSPS
jgi:hypothetical protein